MPATEPPATVASLPSGFACRPAGAHEGRAVADLYLAVRRENLGAIPPGVHSDDDVRAWFQDVLLARDEVWVVERGGVLVGFMALRRPDWVDHLYVLASAAGQGVGTALVDIARRELGGRLQLWTFQSNAGACRFYERLGFRDVERTDGDNEEDAPDVRYVLDDRSIPVPAEADGSVGSPGQDGTS